MTNNLKNKTIAKNTVYLYIRMFFVMIVSIYTVRVVLQSLGVVDYGVYSAIGGVIASLSFFTSVLANASQRFFSVGIGKEDSTQLRNTFSLIFWLYLFVGIIIVIVFESIGIWFINHKMTIPVDRIGASHWVFQCMVLSFLISLLTAPYEAMLIAKEKMSIYAYLGIFSVISKLIVAFLIKCSSGDRLILYAILLMISSAITNAVYLIYVSHNFKEAKVSKCWDKKIFKDVFSFSSWTLFGSVSFIINGQGINVLLNVFFGPVVNAAYAIGNQIKNVVNTFSSNFYNAVRPPLMKAYASTQIDYVKTLFYFSSKVIFILLFIVVFPVFNHIQFILQIWLGAVGDYMVEFVRLMLIYAIIISLSDPITSLIQAANRVKKYYLTVDTFTLLTLPISYVFFSFGANPTAAFYVTIFVFSIAHIIRLFVLSSVDSSFSVTYYLLVIVKPIVVGVLLTIVLSFLISNILNLIISSKLVVSVVQFAFDFIFASITSGFIVLNKSERSRVLNLIKEKIKK